MQRSRMRKLRRQGSSTLKRTLPAASTLLFAISSAWAQTAPIGEIIVTAQKREENLQDVPVSIQAIGTEQIAQLGISDFDEYTRYLPSVSFTNASPGFSLPYFRGVANGENNNHSGQQPTVGMYLDEQPITTIQGAPDLHLYDIARVEALAGPQGTLYGASSMAGTIKIVTNRPDPSGFAAGYDVEGNVVDDGDAGYVLQGFVNAPLSDAAAIRLVGWYKKDAGYIDNVRGERVYPSPDPDTCITNAPVPVAGCNPSRAVAEDDYNDALTYGMRAALRIDLNDEWSVTPSVTAQKQDTDGLFNYEPSAGDLNVVQYGPDKTKDDWYQAALTIEGKIGDFDFVYAGAYMNRDDEVQSDYSDYTFFYDECCGYVAAYWTDDDGNSLADPSQYVFGTDAYKRISQEVRLASPDIGSWRFVTGLFYQYATHDIFQRYEITGLDSNISVTNWPDTIWLTNQSRKDEDYAAFGEVTYTLNDSWSVTGGVRAYHTESELKGFFGFDEDYSSNYGEALCFSPEQFNGSPCTNLDDDVDDDGVLFKGTVNWRPADDILFYGTYSEGFRPSGINRNGAVGPYDADELNNYELGWKTTLAGGTVRFNGAVFYEDWSDIQFSFLPPGGSGLTVISNAGDARIIGLESDVEWAVTDALRLTGGFSWVDAELTDDYRDDFFNPDPDAPPAAPDGTRLPITPEFKMNLRARYDFQVGTFDAYTQLAGTYQTDSYSDLVEADRQIIGKNDAFGQLDFAAGIERDGWGAEFFVDNLTDERGELFKYAQCATDVCGPNPYVGINQPLTFGVRVNRRFGSE